MASVNSLSISQGTLRKIKDHDDYRTVVTHLKAKLGRSEDSPRSFFAVFELFHGTKMHEAGKDWIYKAYEAHADHRGLLQECHRESGKTTVFSKFFFAYRLGHEPHKTWAVVRVNDDKANETTSGVARIIESDPMWRIIFPHVRPDPDKGWGAKGYFLKRTDLEPGEWQRISTSTSDDPTFVGYGWSSGSIIGSRFSGGVIVDDIHNEENTQSPKLLSKIHKFVTETLDFCIMNRAWEIWNFTPWRENDIYAYLISTGEYVHNKTPLLIKADENTPGAEYWEPTPLNRQYPELGNIPLSGKWWIRNWKEAWSWRRIASKYRKAKAVGFARQMLLDLNATKGIVLKRDWLHRFPADQIDPTWMVYFGIDYASTTDRQKANTRDFFALAVLRAMPGGGLILTGGYRNRFSKGEALQQTAAMASIYPTLQLIGVESIGKGEEFYNDAVFVNDALGRPLPLFEVSSHGKSSKGGRFEGKLGPWFQMGRLWVSSVADPFIEQFMDEWLTYPNAQFDDTLDSVYIAALAGQGQLASREEREKSDSSVAQQVSQSPYLSLIAASHDPVR